MPVQLVTIEGNVGTGKTTLARHVANYMPDMKFFPAPEPETCPFWGAFQQSPGSHAYAMQTWFLRERLKVYAAALSHMESEGHSVILDFSIWSDCIFARMHFEAGHMSAQEHAQYQELSREIFALNLPPPHLSVVLQASPSVCLQRLEASSTRSSMPSAAYLQR